MFSGIIDVIFSYIANVKFDVLVWIIWGTFAALTLLLLIMCFALPAIRAANKRPYLCLVNAYAALTLAAFLLEKQLTHSVFVAAVFWVAGYILYGLICLVSKPRRTGGIQSGGTAVTLIPSVRADGAPRANLPAAKSSVRLEHAVSVTDRLLQKELGKSDRQELEKLKTTLAVLQMKGSLSPAESDILNENFNALLKFMAKYNI